MTTTIGTCSLDRDLEGATMTGPTGKHTIDRCGQDAETWEARVAAHWNGFLSNNGVKVAKPIKAAEKTPKLTLPQRSLVDRITSASQKNETYFAQDRHERRVMRNLAALGHGEIMVWTIRSEDGNNTDLSLDLR